MSPARSPTSALDRLRQPEYTGENRCVPCTAANLVIAAVASATVGAVWLSGGVVVLLASLAAIYLRGYLVPGTPALTKRYVPEWLLRRFDKEPAPGVPGDAESDVPGDVEMNDPDGLERFLRDARALEVCDGGDDLCLTADFREAWRDRMREQRSGGEPSFGDLLDVDPDRVSVESHGDAMVASIDDVRIAQWESRAAYVADVAAAAELRERHHTWGGLDFESRTRVLGGLRLWLDRCPACGGAVGFGGETVESCCRSIDVVAATCRACDARLVEAEHAAAGGVPAG